MVEQNAERKYSHSTGWSTVRVFKGHPDFADAKAAELILDGATDVDIEYGPVATVRGTYSGQAPSIAQDPDVESEESSIWSITWQSVEKALKGFQLWSTMQGVDQWLFSQVERDIQDGNWGRTYTDPKWNTYRDLRLAGTEAYLRKYCTIRKTLRSPSDGTIKANYTNGFEVIPYAAINVPASARFQEPKYYDWTGSAWDLVSFEYLTQPTEVTYDETRRVYTLTNEWIGAPQVIDSYLFTRGGWSGTLYKGGSGHP
jgi:hypothetical protein